MTAIQFLSTSPEQTQNIAEQTAVLLKPNAVLCLEGELGSGKTTFVQGMAKALGISQKEIQSPTFVLMRVYDGRLPVYHFDLYRLENTEDMLALGLDDYLYDGGVSIIEWADRLEAYKPEDYICIKLRHAGQDKRNITIEAQGPISQKYLQALKKKI